MKSYKSSFFSFFVIARRHILLKSFAVLVVIVFLPCFVHGVAFSSSQVTPKFVDGKFVSVEFVTKGFISNLILATENQQFWLERAYEFFRCLYFQLVSENGVSEKGSQENTKSGNKESVKHLILYSIIGFLISALIHGYIIFRDD